MRTGSAFAAELAARMPADAIDELDRRIGEARARARERGVAVARNGSLLPNVGRMAAEVGTPEALEAYHIAYSMMSDWTHSGPGGLRLTFTPQGVALDDGPVVDDRPVRAMAAAAYLYTLTIVSREVGLGVEDRCEHLRRQIPPQPGFTPPKSP